MAIPKHLQSLLSLALIFLMLANKVMSDSTDFYLDGFYPNNLDLIYQGDAHLRAPLLSLTKTDSSGTLDDHSVGRVVYAPPVKFWEASPPREAQFEAIIAFTITKCENGPADGITFFITAVNTTIPEDSAGGNFGLYNSSGTATSLFAVEFDTFYNPGWDPSPPHPHIGCNFNSHESNKTIPFNSATGEVVNARIDYVPQTGIISVHASSQSQPPVELICELDLRGILPDHVQVGISASTGRYKSVHEIKTWYFHSNLVDLNGNDDKYIRQMV